MNFLFSNIHIPHLLSLMVRKTPRPQLKNVNFCVFKTVTAACHGFMHVCLKTNSTHNTKAIDFSLLYVDPLKNLKE